MQKFNTRRDAYAKVKEPNTFSGKDPAKLWPFLTLCGMVFLSDPNCYQTGQARVMYAISCLTSPALDYYTPVMEELSIYDQWPAWVHDWQLFAINITLNFGVQDPLGKSADALDLLKMMDNQKIITFLIEFNRIAANTGYNDEALTHALYRSLPWRIQWRMSEYPGGKPRTLGLMNVRAQEINTLHWSRKAEVAWHGRSSNPGNSGSLQTTQKTTSRTTNVSTTPVVNQHTTTTTHTGPPPSYNVSSTMNAFEAERAASLGPDGKLKQEIFDHWLKNSLCLCCGEAGHCRPECPRCYDW
jgi:hypothetical protein